MVWAQESILLSGARFCYHSGIKSITSSLSGIDAVAPGLETAMPVFQF